MELPITALLTPTPALFDTPASTQAPVEYVINWGRGVDSTAYLVAMLDDPARHSVDLERACVITMATGDEWPDSDADAEHFILPLLKARGVRLVQLARGGQAAQAGIDVLDDSRSPERLIRRGRWSLWDEMESNGTVPQQGGIRKCSIRAKGDVGDRWLKLATGGRPFRQMIGFNADETGRRERDRLANKNPLRTGVYPLIDLGWGRQRCEDFLLERLGVRWKKSYCTFCCYPVSMGAMAAHLDRMRAFPEIAGRVLRLEYTAMRLNPNAQLFGRRSLLEQFDAARESDRPVLDAFAQELASCPWAVYHLRRLLPPSTKDPAKPGEWLRSVRRLRTDRPADLARTVERVGARIGARLEVEEQFGSVRAWKRERGKTLPVTEEFLVTAPAYVVDKQKDVFEAKWAWHTGLQPLSLPGT
ncbi:hypothetical protein ABR737_01350 [Streptomyces sp. Edi2]|uniref:hypothetical protein n=1 Tax=Streptomyces sp. Edi2 TaxID=3162528 RepID=UPI003305EAEB